MSNTIIDIIKNPPLLFLTLGHRGFFNWLNDKQYLTIAFWARLHRRLNLDNPQAYNDKLQWLKLYDRNPLYTKLVDKYEVKPIVAEIIGERYIIPTLEVYDKFDEIDFEKLPNRFVLKCTHDSGGLVVCKDKASLNIEQAQKVINQSMRHNYYYGMREWPYKNVRPRIIAEEYMEDSQYGELRDYKFFCFDGVVKALFIASERMNKREETKFDFFDENFNHLPFCNGHPNASTMPKKPKCFDEMKSLAAKLSRGIPHVRIDLYEVDGRVYFGEMTFFHWSGMTQFEPIEWDYKFGEWIKLPNKTL